MSYQILKIVTALPQFETKLISGTPVLISSRSVSISGRTTSISSRLVSISGRAVSISGRARSRFQTGWSRFHQPSPPHSKKAFICFTFQWMNPICIQTHNYMPCTYMNQSYWSNNETFLSRMGILSPDNFQPIFLPILHRISINDIFRFFALSVNFNTLKMRPSYMYHLTHRQFFFNLVFNPNDPI